MTEERTYATYCLDCKDTGVIWINDRTVKAYRDSDGKKRPVKCEHPPDRQVPNPKATPEQHAAFIARIKAQFGGGAVVHAPKAPPGTAPAEPCWHCGTPAVLVKGLCPSCTAAQ